MHRSILMPSRSVWLLIGWPQTVISSTVSLMKKKLKSNGTEWHTHKHTRRLVIKYLYHDLTMNVSFWPAKRCWLNDDYLQHEDWIVDGTMKTIPMRLFLRLELIFKKKRVINKREMQKNSFQADFLQWNWVLASYK